jgi:hypothetical protein
MHASMEDSLYTPLFNTILSAKLGEESFWCATSP